MKKFLFIICTACLFTGCRSFNLTMTSPEQFRSLDSSKVIIGTIDSVLVLKPDSKNAGWKKANMPEVSLPCQKVKNDTIFYSSKQISVAVPFKSISTIKCRGVWNDEVGFISEKEIDKYFEKGFRIGFPFLGAFILVPSSFYLAKEIAHKNAVFEVMGITSIVGLIGGILIGHFFDIEIRYNEAIDTIIESRKVKNKENADP